jgi:UDP-glucose 4-epimerase
LLTPLPDTVFTGVDTVVHLAGMAHDAAHSASVDDYMALNVKASVDLATAAVRSGVQKMIFISSVKASGISPNDCLDEHTNLKPDGVYGQSKRIAEHILLDLGHKYNFKVTVLRPALVYGPGVKGNLHLMRRGIQQGWFPPLPEIHNRRSMVHIDDMIRAILFVIEHDACTGNVYHVTDGQVYSTRQIYSTLRQLVGKPPTGWNIPPLLLSGLGLLGSGMRHRIEKLMGNACYSSKRLQDLGFVPEQGLDDMDTSAFSF